MAALFRIRITGTRLVPGGPAGKSRQFERGSHRGHVPTLVQTPDAALRARRRAGPGC
jgi:hypothetical protein